MLNKALIYLILLFFPFTVFAGVTLPWSTSFDETECTEWTKDESDPNYRNPIDCGGVQEALGQPDSCGNYEQITSSANNPNGSGGLGQRHWYGDGGSPQGSNDGSGGLYVLLDDHPDEIWVRWYMKFPTSLQWDPNSGLHYDKLLYIDLYPLSTDVEVIVEWAGADGFVFAKQGMGSVTNPTSSQGWATVMNNSDLEGDGQWHYYEAHIKIDTDGTDGIAEMWIDDTKIIDEQSVDFGGDSFSVTGISGILLGSNQEWILDGSGCNPVDFDDYAISATGRIGPLTTIPTKGTSLFSESFEDDSWTSRSWYDGTTSTGTEAGGYSGNALKWTWASSATQPTGFSAIRNNLSAETDEFLIEYYVKYDTGWQGSGQAYHPHLIHVLSSDDTAYQGFAGSNSNLYFEALADTSSPYTNYPQIAHQDMMRVNDTEGTPPQDLTSVTEARSANQCNTPYAETGATSGSCYSSGGWYSANTWKSSSVSIPANTWTKITSYIKLNTFTSGTANFDGIMRLWVDEDLAIESESVLYAAGEYEGATWDKIALAPYIGDGAPVSESMWIDELGVWAVNESADTTDPTVTAFDIPATGSSLTVSVNTFTATDNVAVTDYLLNESATTPSTSDPDWQSSAQTSYTFSSYGSKTLYAWAMDAANNISSSLSDSITLTERTFKKVGAVSIGGTIQ